MKKGTKKITAYSKNLNNFRDLEILRNGFPWEFEVENIKWEWVWNGINWSQLSFYCTPETLEMIKEFCETPDHLSQKGLQITFK